MRLQHVAVTFPPGEDEGIRRFYGGVLGLQEMPVPQAVAQHGWIWFATRDEGIELHFIPDAQVPDPERHHHFCLQVDDMADARRRLEDAGTRLIEPGSQIPGRARVFLRDPWGNLIELVQIPG